MGLYARWSDSPPRVMRHLCGLALLATELRKRMLLLTERLESLLLRCHGNGHAGREASLGSRPRPRSGHRVSALRLHTLQMIPYLGIIVTRCMRVE